MAKAKTKMMCHNCLEDFPASKMLRITIDETNPHYIVVCPKCVKEETRIVPDTEIAPYKPFKVNLGKK